MKATKKLLLVFTLFAFLFSFSLYVNLNESFAGPIKIRIGNVMSPGSLDEEVVNLFVILAKNKLQDRVQFDVFGGGTLGSNTEMLEMIKVGSLECLYESIGVYEPWTPLGGVEAVPYLYSDLESFGKFWRGPLGEEYLEEIAKDSGYLMIGPHWRGFRIMTTRKPVRTPDDLKGLKFRVPNLPTYIAAWKAMGANATPVDFTELFSALQQGVVDGQENPLALSYDQGFGEVCKYIVLTNHMAETMGWIWDVGYFSKLPKDVQNALKEAAVQSGRWHEAAVLLSDAKYIDKFKKQGCKIIIPDRQAFLEKGKKTQLNPKLQEWVNKIRKYIGP